MCCNSNLYQDIKEVPIYVDGFVFCNCRSMCCKKILIDNTKIHMKMWNRDWVDRIVSSVQKDTVPKTDEGQRFVTLEDKQ